MRIRVLLGVVGVGLALVVPGRALAAVSVATPQGHEAQDDVPLAPSAEAQLSHESTAKNAAVRANVAAVTGSPDVVGQWGQVVDWPVVAINAALLPDGKVLAYDSIGDQATEASRSRTTRARPMGSHDRESDRRHAQRRLQHLLPAASRSLPNGNIFIAGGNKDQQLDGIVQTHYFDWSTGTWSLGVNMAYPRWYPTVTEMGNSKMLITSGGAKIPEVRQQNGTLRQLFERVARPSPVSVDQRRAGRTGLRLGPRSDDALAERERYRRMEDLGQTRLDQP